VAEDDIQARRADGSSIWVHWSANAVQDRSGATQYYVAMFEDTTARHETERAAAKSLEVLERLNTLKSEFLQNVSHEFKTALIGIQGFSEFMRDADELDLNDVRAFAADIYRDAERLDRMVTEMLALDRAESTRANLRVERVELSVVIRREAEATRKQVHGNTLVLNIQEDLPAVAGDDAKLSEVVRTLLDNAVKRSPEGGVITVSAAANASGVEVSVKDQGVTARAEFDERLFGENDLYANSPIRKVVGTGLGLGIARQVIELHGGRFWVGGAGTEFHFSLPVFWRDRQTAAVLSGSPRRIK
jgi:signal transduction histidine kinase